MTIETVTIIIRHSLGEVWTQNEDNFYLWHHNIFVFLFP